MVQRVALFLCKNYAVSGQKAEQPASTACLLAVLLINMHLSCWSNGGQHWTACVMRYARGDTNFKDSDASGPSVFPSVPFCIYPYSVVQSTDRTVEVNKT